MRVAIFTHRKYLPEGCLQVPMLDPFWRIERNDAGGHDQSNVSEYVRVGCQYFELAPSPCEADAALLPMDWYYTFADPGHKKTAGRLIAEAGALCKPTIIFCTDDSCRPVDWPPLTCVFRNALYRSERKTMEFAMPMWSTDLLRTHLNGELDLRRKSPIPRVGFCGYAPPLATEWDTQKLKDSVRLAASYLGLTRRIPRRSGHAPRARALIELQRSRHIDTEFILRPRSAFANPTGAFLPGGTPQSAQTQRRDFLRNTLDSDYVLCARGYGNCSIRLYETLCLGRIPVYVNTDAVLPYEDIIDWKRYCVWVEERDLPRIGEKVAAFHESLSSDDFIERQRECRKLYEDWLSPEGFYSNLYRLLPLSNSRQLAVVSKRIVSTQGSY